MDVRLDGKLALITGGSKGLGKAMAMRFAESGAALALVARTQSSLDETKAEIKASVQGAKVAVFSCDISTAESCAQLHSDVSAQCGSVDILINNAGTSKRGPFLEISDEEWQGDFDLKVFAAIRLIRHFLPEMQSRNWGRVINVLNIGAKAPPATTAPTAVSRAAGMALTKILAGECGPHGVLVNALHVGLIDSDQWVQRHAAAGGEVSYEEFLDGMAGGIPLGRMGRSEEFANIACFLASDMASYINGVSINVDGGKSPVL
jgi:3-oxoacyl-[acyl-carrier protein] reductase